jgi:hypothetical protein
MKWYHIFFACLGSLIFGYGLDDILIYYKLYSLDLMYEGTPFICMSLGFMMICLSLLAIYYSNHTFKG